MSKRIILRTVARDLTDEEIQVVSGGDWSSNWDDPEDPGYDPGPGDSGGGPDYGGGAGLTGGQPTKKVSSTDPHGPMDEDTSVADW